ncbi:MAG: SufE family protein [Ignavibacteriales bacterium]|nr:SufE family protein [Ignavibacteriales bacterium]
MSYKNGNNVTIPETQDEIVKEFDQYTDWEDKYKRIIDLGRQLASLDETYRTDKYKLSGCQSQVWINAKLQDGKIFFEADSDAAIVKGLIALIIKVYSGHTPDEILSSPPEFVAKIGIDNHLSPTRKNGLGAMMKQIQMYAVAFKSLNMKREK